MFIAIFEVPIRDHLILAIWTHSPANPPMNAAKVFHSPLKMTRVRHGIRNGSKRPPKTKRSTRTASPESRCNTALQTVSTPIAMARPMTTIEKIVATVTHNQGIFSPGKYPCEILINCPFFSILRICRVSWASKAAYMV